MFNFLNKIRFAVRSSKWSNVRKQHLKENPYCIACGRDKKLEVHHKTYKRLFEERLSDLFAVCRTCHELIHQIHKTRKSIKNNLWSATYLAKKQHLGKTPKK